MWSFVDLRAGYNYTQQPFQLNRLLHPFQLYMGYIPSSLKIYVLSPNQPPPPTKGPLDTRGTLEHRHTSFSASVLQPGPVTNIVWPPNLSLVDSVSQLQI